MAVTAQPTAPAVPAPPPASFPAVPHVAVIQRNNWRAHVFIWLRLAYTDLGSREHRALLEGIISLVIVSIVATVLEHDPTIRERYRSVFLVIEYCIVAAFVADYAFNIYFAPNRRGYVFSFWGLIDLLAILPGLLLFVDLTSIKLFRGIRFLRFLRVVKIAREAQRRAQALGEEERRSLFLDLQLSIIVFAAVLLFVPDDGLRDLMLWYSLLATLAIGIRRWLVRNQHPTMAALCLLGGVVGAVLVSLRLDGNGHSSEAVGVLLATVIVALVSWLRIEAPANGL